MEWQVTTSSEKTTAQLSLFQNQGLFQKIEVGKVDFYICYDAFLHCLLVKDKPDALIAKVINLGHSGVEKDNAEFCYKIGFEQKSASCAYVQSVIAPKLPFSVVSTKTSSNNPALVRSPLTGKILNLLVKEGDAVKKGQALATIEAMKMENNVLSDFDGTVHSIATSKLASIKAGEELLKIKISAA